MSFTNLITTAIDSVVDDILNKYARLNKGRRIYDSRTSFLSLG